MPAKKTRSKKAVPAKSGPKEKPERKALVSESELTKIRGEITAEIMEREIIPLKEKLETAIEVVGRRPVPKTRELRALPEPGELAQFICPKCDDMMIMKLFIATAERLRLDPFKKEIYLMPFWDSEKKKKSWTPVVDYKVFLARANEDTDYLTFKSWVEYIPVDERPETPDPMNPWNIVAGVCQIYKRSWARLAKELGQPELAYHEHRVGWEVWKRTYKKDGATKLFPTWKEKGPFYIEKTAIGQCHRHCFPRELGGLPLADYEIISENGATAEGEVLREVDRLRGAELKGSVAGDSEFFDRSIPPAAEKEKEEEKERPIYADTSHVDKEGETPQSRKAKEEGNQFPPEPKKSGKKKITPAFPIQIKEITRLMGSDQLPVDVGNEIAVELASHNDALNGQPDGVWITAERASDIVGKLQIATGEVKPEKE